uniref:L,D-transpeptidase family protein n=1 Tax=Altererythrobacter segetis TaxID=1104773 RepID=UPI00140E231A|nr:L,D-transpeptidase family protein [Altererythrobacter segetis]
MRTVLAAVALMALAACGSNDHDKTRQQPTAAATVAVAQNGADSMASQDPAAGEQARIDIPDSQSRPIMQAQVVLDRQGFGPGVIDGKMGISTENALQGFQEAHGLQVTGKLDPATQQALGQWNNIPATRVVKIPDDWGTRQYQKVPKEPEDQAKLQELGYESLDERLAERFHTTSEVLDQLNPNGQPAGMASPTLAQGGANTAQGNAKAAATAAASLTPAASSSNGPAQPGFHAGQLVRVPNVGADRIDPAVVEDKTWQATLASLGVGTDQPHVSKIVVDKSGGWLKGYDEAGKLVATFTVTTGSQHDPLPLGTWGITTISRNPHFNYNPDLFWDAGANDTKQRLPPGPNGPVGVVWIDLTKEHYGIHGTPEPQTIGRTQSHGCVRLTNWDAARLAQMIDTKTKVVFQA